MRILKSKYKFQRMMILDKLLIISAYKIVIIFYLIVYIDLDT
jgi:hypothetical protein